MVESIEIRKPSSAQGICRAQKFEERESTVVRVNTPNMLSFTLKATTRNFQEWV